MEKKGRVARSERKSLRNRTHTIGYRNALIKNDYCKRNHDSILGISIVPTVKAPSMSVISEKLFYYAFCKSQTEICIKQDFFLITFC